MQENYDFRQDFLKWISILLQNQESCLKMIVRQCGAQQGDPILAYLFLLVLGIVSVLSKKLKLFKAWRLLIINSYVHYLKWRQYFIFQWWKSCNGGYTNLWTFFFFFSGLKPNKSIKKVWNIWYWCSKQGSNGALW